MGKVPPPTLKSTAQKKSASTSTARINENLPESTRPTISTNYPTVMHPTQNVQTKIETFENECISRRDRHTSSFGRKILLFEEKSSPNLPNEKGRTHDVIKQPTKAKGRAGKQPITAQFRKKASLDVSVTNLEHNFLSPD